MCIPCIYQCFFQAFRVIAILAVASWQAVYSIAMQ